MTGKSKLKFILSRGMLFIGILFVLCGFLSISADADNVSAYDVSSKYLKDPENVLAMMRKSAEFWKGSYDKTNGGYFTRVSLDGTPESGSNYKSILSQSRIAYAFSRAYMVTGNREYLKYARYALDYMQKYGWDKKNGGFYTCMDDKTGMPIDSRTDLLLQNDKQQAKWSFMQHYALLGIAAMYDATRNDDDFAFLLKARNILDTKLWDSRKGFEGYYEMADDDWSHPLGKGFTPTVDGITTHGLSLYLLTGEQRYKDRLVQLADNIIQHIYPT
ncbi:MAG TPA: AGE family epimerase/isomerase, partial [Spirochaetota bacterium]